MPTPEQPPVTVVVPCFNDEARLPMLLRRIDSMHANGAAGWRFTFVDDGSTDDTFTTLHNASKTRDWVAVVRHASRLGFGAAVKTGFSSCGSPVICSMGCSDPPSVLEELKKLVDNGADIAVATTATRRSSRPPRLQPEGQPHDAFSTSSDRDTLLSRVRAYRRETLERFGIRGSGALALARIVLRALAANRVVSVVRMAPHRDGAAMPETGVVDSMRLRLAMLKARSVRSMRTWGRRRRWLGRRGTPTTAGARPHRVLIIIENLPYPFDRRVFQEATTLRAAGYAVSVICPIGKGCEARYEDVEGVNVYRYPLHVEGQGILGYAIEYGASLLWQYTLAWKVFFKHGFDVIHACNPPDNIFAIALAFRPFGKKFVFDHHDINPELYDAKFGQRGLPYKLICLLERLSFRWADISIATNESYRKIAIERGGMDPDKVFIVRSGPDLDRVKVTRASPELKRGAKHLVGYVGVMGRQEGIDYLLRAARHLIFEMGRSDVHFGLVGGGTELEAMKEYAAELGLGDHVTFTGRVPDREMLAMLNTADVCVNPDVANEMNDKSTMNKIMEYMALAKPIVQFDLREGRVSAGLASLYAAHNDEVDFARKLETLLDDPLLRLRMGDFGRKRIETRLAWKYEAPKLLQAYATVFGTTTDDAVRRADAPSVGPVEQLESAVAVALLGSQPRPIAEPSAHAVAPINPQ